MSTAAGIPTLYDEQRFRSRLEATWARFFNVLGWRWVYEPFDEAGWIPDFALITTRHPRGVLVEIKPEFTAAGIISAAGKAASYGGDRPVLMLGAHPELDTDGAHGGVVAGVIREHHDGWPQHLTEAEWGMCLAHGGPTFYAPDGDWACQVCGERGEHHGGCDWWIWDHHESLLWLRMAWRRAQNDVQWKPRRRRAA